MKSWLIFPMLIFVGYGTVFYHRTFKSEMAPVAVMANEQAGSFEKEEKRRMCIEKIIVYKINDESFSQPLEESSATIKIRSIAKPILTQKLLDAGFNIQECEAPESGPLYLDVGVYRQKKFFGLKNAVKIRIFVYRESPAVSSRQPMLEIFTEAPVWGKSDEAVQKTVGVLGDKIVGELLEKLPPNSH